MRGMTVYFTWLAGSRASAWVRAESPWLWPLCETLHFVGLAMLVGIAGFIDIRLMGFLRSVPLAAVKGFRHWAAGAFLLNLTTGLIFFTGSVNQYVVNPYWWAKVAFLFNKVGLAGCDMGACAILPRIIGQSRASELLYTGRVMTAEEGEKWGFFSRIVTPEQVLAQAQLLARQIADGPTFGNTMTKRMLAMEWAMSVEEAIEAEAVAQALCMTTEDFARAFEAFSNKRTPVFQGN